jgi:hypothetical protein
MHTAGNSDNSLRNVEFSLFRYLNSRSCQKKIDVCNSSDEISNRAKFGII